ncbi:E3 SUMO-protein ligase KIAA1586-like [Acropora muricata]|uniref:E3 SUMO-protein ligase KIAA1586-like n=1 Tax=Acropora muricata TaxID=159855 RepID=UPI0034E5B548
MLMANGLLSNEVTAISVMEILMTFIQFFNSKTEKVETHFLFVEDVLKVAISANAETIFNILTKKLEDCGLQIQKLSSVASDGAAVMTGERSRVAACLKKVNSKVIAFHCLCHKLALPCTDTTSDIDYIKNIELWVRQLRKMFENSPKRMAIFIKVQIEIKSVNLSDKSKKIVRKKLKKVCQTRWLSFHAAKSAIFDDYLAVLHTLRQLKDADAVAYGLLSKVQTAKFIGTIYIFNAVLPILSSLSKTFQRGTINFSHIKPSTDNTLAKLSEIMVSRAPIVDWKSDLLLGGRLNKEEVRLTPSMEEQLSNLLTRYVTSLTQNIHRRFDHALPVVSSFSIFDPLAVPNSGSPGFKDYGAKEVKVLAKHFYSGDSTKESQFLQSGKSLSTT